MDLVQVCKILHLPKLNCAQGGGGDCKEIASNLSSRIKIRDEESPLWVGVRSKRCDI